MDSLYSILPENIIPQTKLNDPRSSSWYPPRFSNFSGCASEFYAYPTIPMYHSDNNCDFPNSEESSSPEMTKFIPKSPSFHTLSAKDEKYPARLDLPVFQLDKEVESLIISDSGEENMDITRCGSSAMKTSRSLGIPSPTPLSPNGLCSPEVSPRLRRHSFGLRDFKGIFWKRAPSPSLELKGPLRAKYHWAVIRHYISCTFAIRGDKRNPWVQLAGHKDSFCTGGDVGIIRKKLCQEERHCLSQLMDDAARPFVPVYFGTINIDGQEFIEMRDLLTGFDPSVSVMDCKIGIRTYLEDELTKAKENPKMRPDMYQKMIELDMNAPTPEEHAKKAVTKPRYMQWRETLSSSATLGFRIEGIKKADGFSSKDFKFTKSRQDVVMTLKKFTESDVQIIELYVLRLRDLKRALLSSAFFAKHEVIGTSILFIHDINRLAGVWMIDFAKTVPLPANVQIDHVRPWTEGNHEDGYLFGLDNLIDCFQELLIESRKSARNLEVPK